MPVWQMLIDRDFSLYGVGARPLAADVIISRFDTLAVGIVILLVDFNPLPRRVSVCLYTDMTEHWNS